MFFKVNGVRQVFAILVLFIFFLFKVNSDVIILKNGQTFIGKVVSQKDNKIKFQVKGGKVLYFKTTDIAVIEFFKEEVFDIYIGTNIYKAVKIDETEDYLTVKTLFGETNILKTSLASQAPGLDEYMQDKTNVMQTNISLSVTNEGVSALITQVEMAKVKKLRFPTFLTIGVSANYMDKFRILGNIGSIFSLSESVKVQSEIGITSQFVSIEFSFLYSLSLIDLGLGVKGGIYSDSIRNGVFLCLNKDFYSFLLSFEVGYISNVFGEISVSYKLSY